MTAKIRIFSLFLQPFPANNRRVPQKMFDVSRIEFFEKVETPFYFYETDVLRRTVEKVASLASRYDISVHYAVKANSEKRILEYIASAGFGAECVSGNEVLHAHACSFPAGKIIFSGTGKSDGEIAAALRLGIGMFNCESVQEIFVLDAIAGLTGTRARFSVRINPGMDAHARRFPEASSENKFGIPMHAVGDAIEMIGRCRNTDFAGLHFHIGSQITDAESVFAEEVRRANEITERFEAAGLRVDSVNLGGGLGVDYANPDSPSGPDFGTWFRIVGEGVLRRPGRTVRLEPGRSLTAQCGSLITRVLFVKTGETKTFLITDAGMNDMIRPALYGSYHRIDNLSAVLRPNLSKSQIYDIAGPVCESSDVWGSGRLLPVSVRGDLLAIRSAGAYGQVMSSRYNMRGLAPSVYSDDMHGARLRTEYFG